MENVSYIEDPKRLRQTVKPFKAMMENPKSNVEDAAKQVDDMTRDTAYERLYDFIAIYQNTVNNQNFPQDLLRFYSRFSQADDEELTHDEVIAASKIIVRFATLLPSNIQTCDIEIRCKDRFYCVLTVRCC